MGLDLTSMLEDWPYEGGQINVRLIEGEDGDPKLQMRIDLGVLQMEVSGRPDGLRPKGYESLLDYYEDVLSGLVSRAEAEAGDGEVDAGAEATLSSEDCRVLREEALQYYHRYIALLVLGDYEGVARDTTRNLRLLDVCREYAEEEEDRMVLEQFRAYVLMMRTRALASQCVSDGEGKAAVLVIDEGLEMIRGVFEEVGDEGGFEGSSEAALLRGMKAELMKTLPASQTAELRERLERAIEQENYELAAILRDELKTLRDDGPTPRA